jgi:hypothetical protein
VTVTGQDTLSTRRSLTVEGRTYDYFSLEAAAAAVEGPFHYFRQNASGEHRWHGQATWIG